MHIAVDVILEKKTFKAVIPELTEVIGDVLTGEMSRKELIKILCEELDSSKRTIISRLKQVLKEKIKVPTAEGEKILNTRIEKKVMLYYLVEPD